MTASVFLSPNRRRYDLVIVGMERKGLDALLIQSPENITYVSGYETPGYYKYHCLIVGPGFEPVFVLRRFEELNVPEYSWLTRHVPVDDWESPPEITARTLRELKLDRARIGVEEQGWFYTVAEHETLSRELRTQRWSMRSRSCGMRAHTQVSRGNRHDEAFGGDPGLGDARGEPDGGGWRYR